MATILQYRCAPMFLFSAFLVAASPPPLAAAQSEPGLTQKLHARGMTILRSGTQALGGRDDLAAVDTVAMKLALNRHTLGQAVRPEAEPGPAQTTTVGWTMDIDSDRWFLSFFPAPDAPDPAARLVWSEPSRFVHYLANNSVLEIEDESTVADLARCVAFAPRYLLEAWNHASSVRSIPVDSDKKEIVLSYLGADHVQTTLVFDADTNLLTRVESMEHEPHPQLGDTVLALEFGDYGPEGGLVLPHTIQVKKGPYLISTASITEITVNEPLDTAVFELPADASPAPNAPPNEENAPLTVEEIEPGIFMIFNIIPGYNAMFVIVDEEVIIIEAPGSPEDSTKVLQIVAEYTANKPVASVVLTHHHFDHSSGLWAYLTAGKRIITTEGNEAFVRAVAGAPRAMIENDTEPLEPELVLVDSRHSIGAGPNRIELIDAGPNPHADEILVAYFPEHKMLYVPDIYGYLPGFTPPPLLQSFASRLKELDLDIKTIATAHTPLSNIDELNEMVKQTGG